MLGVGGIPTSSGGGGGGGGVSDHGALTGLSDDDHSQYALTNGTRGAFDAAGAAAAVAASVPTTEQIQDLVGAMFSGNTETRVTVTYQDADGTIDVVVDVASFAGLSDVDLTGVQNGDVFVWDTATSKLVPATSIADASDLPFTSGAGVVADDVGGAIDEVAAVAAAALALGLTTEQVQDLVGAMFSGNTETGITATYQDSDGTIDLIVSGGGGGGSLWSPFFGTGIDGALVLDGSSTVTGFTRSGSTYTQTQDVYASDFTINSGVILITSGYRLFASGTITNNGTIRNNGGTATSAVAGTAAPGGTLAAGLAGGAGVTGAGGAGTATGSGSIGTSGGAGGAGSGGAGGAAGVVTPNGNSNGGVMLFNDPVAAMQWKQVGNAQARVPLGSGGGAGGGDGTNNGRGGGGSGGGVLVCGRLLAGSGVIEAKGGDGASGAAGNVGGGGGGAGGVIVLITTSTANPWTTSVAGGAAGTGFGTGSTGSAGTAGRTFVFLGI